MERNGKNILLVQLYSELQPTNAEPFAIEVLASAIEKECPDCAVSMTLANPAVEGQSVQNLTATIESSHCDILGFSIPQGTLSLALKILDRLELLYANATRPTVVLGHALPTYVPEQFLKRHPWTVAVHGWGEDALIVLVKGHTPLAEIPGIY